MFKVHFLAVQDFTHGEVWAMILLPTSAGDGTLPPNHTATQHDEHDINSHRYIFSILMQTYHFYKSDSQRDPLNLQENEAGLHADSAVPLHSTTPPRKTTHHPRLINTSPTLTFHPTNHQRVDWRNGSALLSG